VVSALAVTGRAKSRKIVRVPSSTFFLNSF
jgi:hypothetical protein